MLIDVRKIAPNPQQPRTRFRQDELDELARSMQSTGLIQPIVVEAGTAGGFILVDGERRWRAASQLGWSEIDAVIREASKNDVERLVSAFVANEQRADMNPMERCKAYREMLQALGTVQEVAREYGGDILAELSHVVDSIVRRVACLEAGVADVGAGATGVAEPEFSVEEIGAELQVVIPRRLSNGFDHRAVGLDSGNHIVETEGLLARLISIRSTLAPKSGCQAES